MVYKSLYISLLVHVILLCGWSIALGFAMVKPDYFYLTLCIAGIAVTAASLLYRMNRTNRKLENFFNSVKTKDTTLVFPEGSDLLRENELSKALLSMGGIIKDLSFSLEKQKGFLNTIMSKVKTGVISFLPDERVDFANHAVLELFQLPALTHLKQFDQFTPELREKLLQLNRGDQKQIQVMIQQLPVTLLVQCEKITLVDQQATILSIQNIKSELDQTEMEAWIKLIRMLNHEITNSLIPITSISSSMQNEFGIKDGQLPKQLTEGAINRLMNGIKLIHEHGNGLLHFVQSFQRFTRIPKPVLKDILFAEFMDRIVLLSKAYITDQNRKTAIRFHTKILPANLILKADEDQLGQVFLNLVKNAIESFPVDHPDPQISIRAANLNEQITVSISDNGQGIPSDLMDQVFVPFFTTKKEGSGIGLAMSRQILKLHGAEISVAANTSAGRGTRFSLVFRK